MIHLEYDTGVRRWLSSKLSISFCNVVSLRGQLVQLTLVTYGCEETMSGGPHPRVSSPLSLNGEVPMSAGSSSAEQRPGISSFKRAPRKP
jgi:hypothetical protein